MDILLGRGCSFEEVNLQQIDEFCFLEDGFPFEKASFLNFDFWKATFFLKTFTIVLSCSEKSKLFNGF